MKRNRRRIASEISGVLPRSKTSWRLFFVLAFTWGIACTSKADDQLLAFPENLEGQWHVASVLVDLGTSRTLMYQRDDPRLIGANFLFSGKEIVSSAPEARECQNPHVTKWSAKLSTVLATTFASRGDNAVPPIPKDYEIPIVDDPSIDIFSVECVSGRFGPRPPKAARALLGRQDLGTWLTMLPGDLVAIRWYDETILLLRR